MRLIRMEAMRTKLVQLALLVFGLVFVAGCGAAQPQQSERPGARASKQDPVDDHDLPDDLKAPPPVTIRYGDDAVELQPWTYCYGTGCADGIPPEDPHDIGSPSEVIIEFPLEGWTFGASFKTADGDCARDFPAETEGLGDGRFLLRPAGYAGTYDVTVSGDGGGDLFVTFRWTTPSDGPLPAPKARLAVLADHDGELDSYGVELALSDLATTPKRAAATITVRAANGEKVTFAAKASRGNCWGEGNLYWDGPDAAGLEAAKLPGDRFTYEVEVTLDGERHVATATWPDDVIEGNEPSVRLDFEPELPALQPRL